MAQPTEFWIVSVPSSATPGASLGLLDVKDTSEKAKAAVDKLPTDVVGRVAILERIALFQREMAVKTTETEEPVKGTGG
jgi:hypothetical protein